MYTETQFYLPRGKNSTETLIADRRSQVNVSKLSKCSEPAIFCSLRHPALARGLHIKLRQGVNLN